MLPLGRPAPAPEQKEVTVAQAWAAERGVLQPVAAPFDRF